MVDFNLKSTMLAPTAPPRLTEPPHSREQLQDGVT